jgi:hypothetical protein
VALVAGMGLAAPALAQQARRISFLVMVAHASEEAGTIDPRAQRLHSKLHRDFRYQSLEVLEQRRIRLSMDEIGQMQLPTGSLLKLRPLNLSGDRVLVAVEVGRMRTDLRMKNKKIVILSDPKGYRGGGRIVISFEPDF